MKPSPESELERLIDRTLRDLPPLRAPSSLSGRVRAELERRAALPWWRRSFRDWPRVARSLFVLVAAASAWAVPAALAWAGGRGRTAAPLPLAETAGALGRVLGEALVLVWQQIPVAWVQAVLVGTALLAAGCFGLGVAGYRVLRAES